LRDKPTVRSDDIELISRQPQRHSDAIKFGHQLGLTRGQNPYANWHAAESYFKPLVAGRTTLNRDIHRYINSLDVSMR